MSSGAWSNVSIVAGFWFFNQLLGIFNSWAFRIKGFKFPCLVSISQSIVYALFVLVAAGCGSTRFRRALGSSSSSWSSATNQRVRSVAFWSTFNVILNNISLVYLPLSLNQVLRATIPVITALLSVVHGQVPSLNETAALTLLVSGVLVVIGQSLEFSFDSHQMLKGLFFCLSGTVAAANALHATSRALNEREQVRTRDGTCMSVQLTVVDLAWRIVPWNIALVLPLFAVSELQGLSAYMSENPSGVFTVVWVTGASSILASSYNLVHWMLAGRAGPVMTTVLGQLKIVSLVVISRVFMEDSSVHMTEICGFIVAFLGFAWYGWLGAKARESVASAKQA